MTENEKILGIDTIKCRLSLFHTDRCKRMNLLDNLDYFSYKNISTWDKSKIIKEWRDTPEGRIEEVGAVDHTWA